MTTFLVIAQDMNSTRRIKAVVYATSEIAAAAQVSRELNERDFYIADIKPQ